MRRGRTWLAVAIVVLGGGAAWADEFAADRVLLTAADGPMLSAPRLANGAGESPSVPNTPPVLADGPGVAPSGLPVPMAQTPPVAPQIAPHADAPCGCTPACTPSCDHSQWLHCWQWLTYRALPQECMTCRPKCQPCGVPPLYIFFLCDRWRQPHYDGHGPHAVGPAAAANGGNANKDGKAGNQGDQNQGNTNQGTPDRGNADQGNRDPSNDRGPLMTGK
jgi:hypothetical protein